MPMVELLRTLHPLPSAPFSLFGFFSVFYVDEKYVIFVKFCICLGRKRNFRRIDFFALVFELVVVKYVVGIQYVIRDNNKQPSRNRRVVEMFYLGNANYLFARFLYFSTRAFASASFFANSCSATSGRVFARAA